MKTAGSVDGIGSNVDSIGSNGASLGRSGDSISSSGGGVHSSNSRWGRQQWRRKWQKVSSNDRSSVWTSQNKREFGHSFKMRNSYLCTYTRKQNQHMCLTSCLIRSLVRHLEAMVLQLHEYLMRCLSDIHTSPHQRKRPCIMVQPSWYPGAQALHYHYTGIFEFVYINVYKHLMIWQQYCLTFQLSDNYTSV